MQNSSSSPASTLRTEAPRIPDHEVLRCIGKGSYGEVWLARSVTGALRAVKVVRREDFELDRTFEREFEGIKRFEPISRDHPGLVHILHVGRNDEEGFYYYVMELGDDRETGSRVEPGDYEARTMGTDRTMRKRLSVEECVQHGIVLADALAHLHEHGLTHRDIKPSNIIFVNGKPKLADIGLVAAAGQMTFVGTEGFVPPEGPGTASADIYSLGMVLYEMSTGNDRLQFPELPNDLGNEAQRPMWRALNDVICKACAPSPKKRYTGSRQMAEALRAAWRIKHGRRRWVRRLVMLPVLSAIVAFVLVTWRHGGTMPWPPGRFGGSAGGFLPVTGSVSLTSHPDGVDVIFEGRVVGQTPVTVDNIPPGTAIFTLRRSRYIDASVSVSGVSPGETVQAQNAVLQFFDPPRLGQPWENSIGMPFDPRQTDHISRYPVSLDQFLEVLPDVMSADVLSENTGDGQIIPMVRVAMTEAVRFCDLLARRDIEAGYFPDGYCYRPEPYQTKTSPDEDSGQKDMICFRLIAEKAGSVTITSKPAEAAIYEGTARLEVTPFTIPIHRTGAVTYRLRKEGFEDLELTGVVKSGEILELKGELRPSLSPVTGQPWENSLGMKFQPLGKLLFGVWEVRVKDYADFAKETGRTPGIVDADKNGQSDIGQTELHPVVNVTRADAVAYCQWLTVRERASRHLTPELEYRLPADAEWSFAAGSGGDDALDAATGEVLKPDPAARHNRWTNIFPWVPLFLYPPPGAADGQPAAANLGDLTALQHKEKPLGPLTPQQIKELEEFRYTDGVPFTAPAGQFRPSPLGIYDLSGNVWEFVADDYGTNRGKGDPKLAAYAVTRGASWAEPVTKNRELFYTQYRRAVPPDKEADSNTGFRVVVAPVAKP